MLIFDFQNIVIILIIECPIEFIFVSVKGQDQFNALHFSYSLLLSIIAVILINRCINRITNHCI